MGAAQTHPDELENSDLGVDRKMFVIIPGINDTHMHAAMRRFSEAAAVECDSPGSEEDGVWHRIAVYSAHVIRACLP
jgi:cytosine/adenosine deaminase-related metal-dependent hydrolase